MLAHTTDDCAGRWRRGDAGWCCTRCGATYGDRLAVRFAVLRECELERVIGRLVREGRRLLAGPAEGRRGFPEDRP